MRTAKNYALDSSVSDEVFLNVLLEPYVIAGRVKARNGASFHLDKARTSKIMNGKADVPLPLKKPLARTGIEERTAAGFEIFLEESFDLDCFEQFASDVIGMINDDSIWDKTLKGRLAELTDVPCSFFAHGLIAAIKACNLASSSKILWHNGTGSLSVEIGDILGKGFCNARKLKNIVIIPVNTAFDTEVSWQYEQVAHPLVSARSIHGQWLMRMFNCGQDSATLKARIREDLSVREIEPERTILRDGMSVNEYPIGAVAAIENDKAIFYLLAISSFDRRNNAQSTSEAITRAIESVLEVYDKCGQSLDLYIPLLGTGMSRAGLNHADSYDLLTGCIEDNKRCIHGKVAIMIHPKDKDKLDIQL